MNPFESRFGTSQPVVLATGAGKPRLGQTIARHLHAQGARVVLHAQHSWQTACETAAAWARQGPDAMAFQADLAQSQDVQRLVDECLERFGRIDMLVHAAAIWSPLPLEAIGEAELENFLSVNTKATFWLCQKVGLAMTSQREGGSLLLFGDWALERPYRNYAAYFASKGSIPTLTRTFAMELGLRNPRVNVNALLPGPVTLPDSLTARQRDQALQGMLTRPEGSPETIASIALPLLVNHHITGTCLPVDGGRTIYAPDPDYKQLDA